MPANSEAITNLKVAAYTVPTDYPESDGTLQWNSTTMVLVELEAMGQRGIGYTYADASLSSFIATTLMQHVKGQHPFNTPKIWQDMLVAIRNEGSCGMAMMAVSAVDNALWDLKAKILNLPLAKLLGMVKSEALLYGSGGFTSYPIERLQQQLGGWADHGFQHVKMKIGRDAQADLERVQAARESIGDNVQLFVDANGAYDAKTAITQAKAFADHGVTWFEEPVSSDDLAGLYFIRNHTPPEIRVAAGEYGYNIGYFNQMLKQQAVDVLQADATRCGGITGFLKAGYLCEAYHLPFSFHCAPALHLHPCLALNAFYIGEYFYDHARIENLFFEGVQQPGSGRFSPDLSRPGLGLEFRQQDAAKFKVN
ncbi:enolase C-terminal domain-like protein [Pontibacter flavimaris]|uniref:Mandelate racemase n=1 Tax=Pontibacter flavimaris TaxID=1797110 RepID=A0A1Q5P8F6_9BACT|nr:enolase C-terminal domain-like protein [Pontibacter flavimaris]OKL38484.1 mandelate racemase [Pontibacter flavimaris]